MFTGRGEDIFEITDEPLVGDGHTDTRRAQPGGPEPAREPSTSGPRGTRRGFPRLVAAGGLVASAVALLIVTSRPAPEDQRSARPAPPSKRPAAAAEQPAGAVPASRDRVPRRRARRSDRRRPSVEASAARTSPVALAVAPPPAVPHRHLAKVPAVPLPAPAAPYEEFGFER